MNFFTLFLFISCISLLFDSKSFTLRTFNSPPYNTDWLSIYPVVFYNEECNIRFDAKTE